MDRHSATSGASSASSSSSTSLVGTTPPPHQVRGTSPARSVQNVRGRPFPPGEGASTALFDFVRAPRPYPSQYLGSITIYCPPFDCFAKGNLEHPRHPDNIYANLMHAIHSQVRLHTGANLFQPFVVDVTAAGRGGVGDRWRVKYAYTPARGERLYELVIWEDSAPSQRMLIAYMIEDRAHGLNKVVHSQRLDSNLLDRFFGSARPAVRPASVAISYAGVITNFGVHPEGRLETLAFRGDPLPVPAGIPVGDGERRTPEELLNPETSFQPWLSGILPAVRPVPYHWPRPPHPTPRELLRFDDERERDRTYARENSTYEWYNRYNR